MAVIVLMMMGLSLLMQGCLCINEEVQEGCKKWDPYKEDVCCEACHPGNRLVTKCGQKAKDLCKTCEPGTFNGDGTTYQCTRCTQCVGAQILLEPCTATTDTKCGCEQGLTCGDERCSFCVDTCGKGQEPTDDRSCRPCPEGTFNDKIQQKCKPWSTKCPYPNQYIAAKGSAVSDIICNNATISPVVSPTKPGQTDHSAWPVVLSVLTSIFLIAVCVIITSVAVTILRKRKKTKKPIPKTPIIRTPTDDPRTLIAIECSFHEAQQEQGSSSESLNSKDSTEQLIV
ncbi:tumor necrosis factor receptor superfamily member 9a [Mugil cephalus]|uniref:tumor necrosis factor receptor superfamily member 9a n=1 Tax=Mugil cephalus TaxID=48193 RepID=UPI001FB6BA8E|nr:tumor necrosis factor receptor superfamily member 9a [Mugil cephalus]